MITELLIGGASVVATLAIIYALFKVSNAKEKAREAIVTATKEAADNKRTQEINKDLGKDIDDLKNQLKDEKEANEKTTKILNDALDAADADWTANAIRTELQSLQDMQKDNGGEKS